MKRTIDEERARELAVRARCDPRTIKKVLRGETVRGSVADRAREALTEAGYLDKPPTHVKLALRNVG